MYEQNETDRSGRPRDAEVEHVTHVPQATVVLLLLLDTSPNVAPGLFPHDTTTTVASS